jgi:NAD(P)H-hydrate epimerase
VRTSPVPAVASDGGPKSLTTAPWSGAATIVSGPFRRRTAPDHGAVVSDFGPPSLATAGTGDVLTGVVAAFLAKGVEPQLAAVAAAVAHGRAAELVPHASGLVASDLLETLPAALDR